MQQGKGSGYFFFPRTAYVLLPAFPTLYSNALTLVKSTTMSPLSSM